MRIEECEGVSASRKHLVFAYYVTVMVLAMHSCCRGIIGLWSSTADALTVDRLASLEKVSDVVPVACRAAADAGIRSVCVTNFRKKMETLFVKSIIA
uniref:Uncharacterized protein n=1 Tax=Salix viminalis TaxID=40686 RepID=A0A6N2KM50_SALVM